MHSHVCLRSHTLATAISTLLCFFLLFYRTLVVLFGFWLDVVYGEELSLPLRSRIAALKRAFSERDLLGDFYDGITRKSFEIREIFSTIIKKNKGMRFELKEKVVQRNGMNGCTGKYSNYSSFAVCALKRVAGVNAIKIVPVET